MNIGKLDLNSSGASEGMLSSLKKSLEGDAAERFDKMLGLGASGAAYLAPACSGAPAPAAPTSPPQTGGSDQASVPDQAAPPGGDAAAAATLKGDNKSVASASDQAPAGMSVADIKKLDSNLLDNLGNQDLQGKGKLKDLFAKKEGGKDASSIDTDPNVAWRVEKDLQADKNETKADGKPVSDSVRHDGKLDGESSHGDAERGTNMGSAQDFLLHGRAFSSLETGGKTSTYANDDGTEKSGAQVAGKKIENVVDDIGNTVKGAFKGIGHFVEGVGKGVGDVFQGKFAKAGSDFVHGTTSAVKDVATPVLKTAADVARLTPVAGDAAGNVIDGVSKGVNDYAGGIDHAATDAFHGHFSAGVKDIASANQQAFSDVSSPVTHFASTVLDNTPLKDTGLAKAVNSASDWTAKEVSSMQKSMSNTVAAPAEDMGQAATDIGKGDLSAVGKDLKKGAIDGANLAATAAPMMIPGAGEGVMAAETLGKAGLNTLKAGGDTAGSSLDMLQTASKGINKANDAYDGANNVYQGVSNNQNI